MHLCITRMPRMLATALLSALFAISAFLVFAPQAHADKLPSIASLIAEGPMPAQLPQVRIDDDPTPLATLLNEQLSIASQEASKQAKLAAFKDEARAGEFYFAQAGSGKCTITSVAMMVRRAAFLDDDEAWQSICRESVSADGWTSAGVKNSFSTAGYQIEYVHVGGHDALVQLLEEHPEGIAAYDPGVPHAVLLTDYDAETGTFYCADPANYYSGSRIPVESSWNGARRGSQSSVVAGFRSAWIIVR